MKNNIEWDWLGVLNRRPAYRKDELDSLFYNAYSYFRSKNLTPDEVKEEIQKFRSHFPKNKNRIKGLNYFDDYMKSLLPEESKQPKIEPLEIEKASHKILILHELGVLDYLKKNYPALNIDTNTNLSKLLAPLLGEKPETIRGALKYLNEKTKSNPRGIIHTVSVRKVKAELSKLGIEVKNLPDY